MYPSKSPRKTQNLKKKKLHVTRVIVLTLLLSDNLKVIVKSDSFHSKKNPTEKKIKIQGHILLSQKWKAWDCTLLGKLKSWAASISQMRAKDTRLLGQRQRRVYFSVYLWAARISSFVGKQDYKVKQQPTNSQKICAPCITEKGLFTVIYLQIL